MEDPFDYEETTTQIQARMLKFRLKNMWMITQLRDEGVQVTEGSFSRIIRNFTHSDYAENILKICVRILDDYERLFLNEMKKFRESSLSPDGQGTYEIIYDYCPADGEGSEEHNLQETFHGTWDELQDYIKEMRQTGCYNINAMQLDAESEKDAEVGGQNLPAEDLNIEEQQKNAGRENGIFEYEGYHFEPAGTYEGTERAGFWQACANDMYVIDAFMEDEPGENPAYVKELFYAAADVPEDEINLFRCIETGKILVAGEASLFLYDGPIQQNGRYTSCSKENENNPTKTQSETEEATVKPAVTVPKRRGR